MFSVACLLGAGWMFRSAIHVTAQSARANVLGTVGCVVIGIILVLLGT